jgi:hypothetical protein
MIRTKTRSLNRFNERKIPYEERVRAARAEPQQYRSEESDDSRSTSSHGQLSILLLHYASPSYKFLVENGTPLATTLNDECSLLETRNWNGIGGHRR